MRKIFSSLAASVTLLASAVHCFQVQISLLQRIQAMAAIKSYPNIGNYEFKGCFADSVNRSIPVQTAKVQSVEDCKLIAENEDYTVFGLQNGGVCFIGTDNTNYTMYGKGPDSECGSILGGDMTNMVFKRPPVIVG
jgi:hypothetical protein